MFKPEVTVKTKTNPFSSTNVKCQRSGPVIIIPCCWLPLQFPLGQWTFPRSWGLSLTPKGQTGALKRNSGSIIITMGTLVSWELFCVGLSGMSAVRFVLDPSEHLEHWQKGRWQKKLLCFAKSCVIVNILLLITVNKQQWNVVNCRWPFCPEENWIYSDWHSAEIKYIKLGGRRPTIRIISCSSSQAVVTLCLEWRLMQPTN